MRLTSALLSRAIRTRARVEFARARSVYTPVYHSTLSTESGTLSVSNISRSNSRFFWRKEEILEEILEKSLFALLLRYATYNTLHHKVSVERSAALQIHQNALCNCPTHRHMTLRLRCDTHRANSSRSFLLGNYIKKSSCNLIAHGAMHSSFAVLLQCQAGQSLRSETTVGLEWRPEEGRNKRSVCGVFRAIGEQFSKQQLESKLCKLRNCV